MAPKKSRTGGRKAKQPVVEAADTNGTTGAVPVDVKDSKEEPFKQESSAAGTELHEDNNAEVKEQSDAPVEAQDQVKPEPEQPSQEDTQTVALRETEKKEESDLEQDQEKADIPLAQSELERGPEAEAEKGSKSSPTAQSTETDNTKAQENTAVNEGDVVSSVKSSEKSPKSKKRKAVEESEDTPADKSKEKSNGKPAKKAKTAPKVEPTRGSRSRPGAQKIGPPHEQILNYLLSDAAAELCRPDDESQYIKEHSSNTKTYSSSSSLSPFEELVCATVLARPISHTLGQRAIRTLLNKPYNFTTPQAIIDAGRDEVYKALDDAKTQHKDKTADQIVLIAKETASKFSEKATDTDLNKLRQDCNKDWWEERKVLKESIKGLGDTGLNIFYRRVQWLWEEGFPYVDGASARGLDKIGLPKTADGLLDVLKEQWDKLDTDNLSGDDEEAKKRRAFVIICERATGADLDRKSEEVLAAVASS